MKKPKLLLGFLIGLTILSCSLDSNQNSNEISISISDFILTVEENPVANKLLGTIDASTNQGDLTFSITEQIPNDAFDINSSTGELTVLTKSLFNFEMNSTITGIVKVQNGNVSENANVTIKLINVGEKYYKRSYDYYDGKIVTNREIYYNSFNKIDSIALNTNSRSSTQKVNYTGNIINSIIYYYIYPPAQSFNNQEATYNVITETNKITLNRVSDSELTEIYFTNQFIDSIVTPNSKETFARNSEQNLILRKTFSTFTVIGNHTYTYSNFDSNKKNKPLGTRPMAMNPFSDSFNLLDIFNLKVSNSNPLTLNINGNEFNFILDYDQNGFIEKSRRDNEQASNYIEYKYIEL